MTDFPKGAMVTYTDADGGTEVLWNARDGAVPETIVTALGKPAVLTLPDALDAVAEVPVTADDGPPQGMRQVVDFSPQVELAVPGTVKLGWPGTPALVAAGDPLGSPVSLPGPPVLTSPPILDTPPADPPVVEVPPGV